MQENLNDFWKVIVEYWFLIAAIIATFIMAIIRTAKKDGKIDYLESIMCAIFTYGVWFMLDWLGLPSEVGIGIGVFIAYIGTLRFSNWVRSKLGIK